jgi:hypothetical protein
MTVSDFLQHHNITENPFRGEEARSDTVFARMKAKGGPVDLREIAPVAGKIGPGGGSANPPNATAPAPILYHSDFEKILGDLRRPASAVVFGEKGSGKTAIRLQIAERLAEHNATQPNNKILLVAYDDLNGVLGRLHERVNGKTPLESLQKIRLVDHFDAILHSIVPPLVDAMLNVQYAPGVIDLNNERKPWKKLDTIARRDLLLLQALYDRTESADLRTVALRKRLGIWPPMWRVLGNVVAVLGPIVIAGLALWAKEFAPDQFKNAFAQYLWYALILLYLVFLAKRYAWDLFMNRRLGRLLRRQLRVIGRSYVSFADSAAQLASILRDPGTLPLTDSDEPRYSLMDRLRRVLRPFGYQGLIIIMDRVDEPTLVNGDPDRMKAIVWPMLNNKFLQQEGVGVKMLLPVELRHSLFRESSAFFQEARLDKQSLVERLTWSGAMLYDLCTARLNACRVPGAPPIALTDLFAEDTTRQDLVDALDQMHQPRDAFKLLYRCINEHCSNVTKDQNAWKIPRLVLDHVKKQEAERVQQLYRGIRPG